MRQEKQLLLDDIRNKMKRSKGFVLTRYERLNPNLAAQLRFQLHAIGGDFEVVPKRIFSKAAAEAGVVLERMPLEGHLAFAFSAVDPLQTVKTVFRFKEENEKILEVIGGQFEGQLYSARDIEALSKLPAKEEMRAQLLGMFEAVPAQLLGVINAALSSIPCCLENKATK